MKSVKLTVFSKVRSKALDEVSIHSRLDYVNPFKITDQVWNGTNRVWVQVGTQVHRHTLDQFQEEIEK